MDAGNKSHTSSLHESSLKRPGFLSIFRSPLVLGGVFTVLFYEMIPWMPVQRELLERYFCSHPLEYATATLFFIGMAVLVLKRASTSIEKSVVTRDLFRNPPLDENAEVMEKISLIETRLGLLPPRLMETYFVRRIRDVCVYIRGRKSSENLDEHLKYLAELASLRMHESYAPVRTITWAVPIIGFLGTVVGITIAVANVTPEQLDSSLSEVTGGLAVAFDTTALALTLSIVLVFSTFFVERSEQQVLSEVEEFGICGIIPLFPMGLESKGPLFDAEKQAAELLLHKTEALIDRQTKMWHESLESMRERWTQTLARQSQQLSESLQQGTSATLADHSQQLKEVREQFLQSAHHVRKLMTEGLGDARESQRIMQESFSGQVDRLWQLMRKDISGLQDHQKEQMEQFLVSLSRHVMSWQTMLKQTNETGMEQMDELRKQREVLLQVLGEEQELARLQTKLTDNLKAIRASETFEKTLLSLSAAVNLLTSRSRPNAA
ncbi:MAG: MotA/TolQ/ExbB proton channel family protein [Planctomycetes bacterium]|nr:MotA/TolQ/ExbB proton channel family protein [Planctomycetota bacterium]